MVKHDNERYDIIYANKCQLAVTRDNNNNSSLCKTDIFNGVYIFNNCKRSLKNINLRHL